MGVRTECPKCHAMVCAREKEAFCGGGKRVLGESFNPPLRPQYKALLQSPHVRHLKITPARPWEGRGAHHHNQYIIGMSF